MRNPRSRLLFFVLVLVPMLVTAPAFAAEVETRRVNNDMVVLEAVPEGPERLVDQLNRYQNTRGASFQDFGPDGGFGGGAAQVIANPVTDGNNASAQVARMLKFAAEPFGGGRVALAQRGCMNMALPGGTANSTNTSRCRPGTICRRCGKPPWRRVTASISPIIRSGC